MSTELKNKPSLSEDLQWKFDEAGRIFESGDYTQAANLYKEVIRAEPEYVPALNKLAGCCIKANAEDDAIAIFKRIIELRPRRHPAHAKLARLLNKKEAFSEAAKEYKAAISLEAEQPDWVFIGLGKALRKLKQSSTPENN